jgi:phosphoglycerate kinase
MKALKEFDFKNKKVLLRCDFNVPLDLQGNVLDDFRIRQALPTINYLLERGAKVILMSHLGSPKGKIVDNLRLDPVQKKLIELLQKPVVKVADCLGPEVERQASLLSGGEVLLLENLRFHSGEEEGEDGFAKNLAVLGDIYINDAFGACHRAHASISLLPKFLPSGAGLLLEKEISSLSKVLQDPIRPVVALVGGAKIESKILVIKSFLEKADHLLLGGKIANSVLGVKGVWIDGQGLSPEIIQMIEQMPLTSTKLHLPIDALVSADISGQSYVKESALAEIKKDELLLDIGPETINIFSRIIQEAKTIVWVGPFGLFENPLFARGTAEMAKAIVGNKQAFKVAGGGETLELINKLGLANEFNHISTGGGAMLAFLSGEILPGIAALK